MLFSKAKKNMKSVHHLKTYLDLSSIKENLCSVLIMRSKISDAQSKNETSYWIIELCFFRCYILFMGGFCAAGFRSVSGTERDSLDLGSLASSGTISICFQKCYLLNYLKIICILVLTKLVLITYFGWVPISCEECEFVHDHSSPPPFLANNCSEETETLLMASPNGDFLVIFTFIGQFFKGLYAQKPDYSELTLTWSKPLPFLSPYTLQTWSWPLHLPLTPFAHHSRQMAFAAFLCFVT